jgi:hypothetical protein
MLRAAAQRLAKRAAPRWGAAARPALAPLARHYADDANLLKTALYDFHLEMGGKMVRARARVPHAPRGATGQALRARAAAPSASRRALAASIEPIEALAIDRGVARTPRSRWRPDDAHRRERPQNPPEIARQLETASTVGHFF